MKRRLAFLLFLAFVPPCIWFGLNGGIVNLDDIRRFALDDTSAKNAVKVQKEDTSNTDKRKKQLSNTVKRQSYASIPSQNDTKQNNNDAPMLILHIGPPKTATTTIQWYAGTFAEKLEQNNIYYVGYFWQKKELNTHEIGYACRQRVDEECKQKWGNLKRILDKHYDKKHNVFFSEEILSDFPPHLENKYMFRYLKPMLSKWRVRVLISYRRLHDWIPSWYTQKYQITPGRLNFLPWPESGGFLVPTMEEYFDLDGEFRYNQMAGNPTKWGNSFSNTEVRVFNMHGDGDFEKEFFCQMIPEATQFCNFMRKQKEVHSMNLGANKTMTLHYDILTMEAHKGGWIDENVSRNDARVAAEEYGKEIGYAGEADFPRHCLSQNRTDALLNMSLALEAQMAPEFFASPQGETELRSSFAAAVEKGKFCSIDASKTLKDKRWKQFFKKLKPPATVQADVSIALRAKKQEAIPASIVERSNKSTMAIQFV